jgi:hypothetical protein
MHSGIIEKGRIQVEAGTISDHAMIVGEIRWEFLEI